MKILTFISNLIHNNENQNQISKVRQAPELPREMLETIFSYMTLSEVSQLGISCKDWNKYTRPHLELLKKQVITLCETCESYCFIPAYKVYGIVSCIFACNFQDDKIIVEKSLNLDPDFYMNTTIKVLNIPIEDSALTKKFKIFFCSGRCIDFACTILYTVRSVDLKHNLSKMQKARITAIYNAMNLYLKYRDTFFQ